MLQIRRQLSLLILLAIAASAQTSHLKEAEFLSQSLGRTMKYRVLLPDSYSHSEMRYPVLYLLHGLYGDYKNWSDKTTVQQYASGLDLIIVMPDANDSWYTNWNTDSKQKYEDYIVKDLLEEIENHYRTTATRDTRFIAGLSMGGYGALKFGLKYPQLFSIAASFSGALNAPTNLAQEFPAFAAQLNRTYGAAKSKTRLDNDVYTLAAQADPAALPYLFLDCGIDDGLLKPNREFVAGLPQRKIRYEYHEFPGRHDWVFWDRSIRMLMDILRERIQ